MIYDSHLICYYRKQEYSFHEVRNFIIARCYPKKNYTLKVNKSNQNHEDENR